MRAVTYGGIMLIVATLGTSHAQSPNPSPQVEELMSAQQFRQAGLVKLSSEELKQLNVWLSTYTRAVVNAATGAGRSSTDSVGTASTIESRIDGEFTGWQGETVFKLQNGQIWQQASFAYKYKYIYSPKVLIYSSGGLFHMKVDGVDEDIAVRRLK
jgi:hypothetical protein